MPRCTYCGRFIAKSDFSSGLADGMLIYCSYPPEPSHDEFWHNACKDKVYGKFSETSEKGSDSP